MKIHCSETDLLVIDEVSMIDTILMNNLLKAVSAKTILVLVRDVDQLPSVGAGNILRDMIGSEIIPVTNLLKIVRQAEKSKIIVNAH
ncbi:MAG: AAA family ATPase, partial [bacterium]